MDVPGTIKRNLYFTNDHEWIDFQGSVAYVGISHFKLSGIKQIQQIVFVENPDLIKQGDVIASIQCGDYRILVHMPVAGKIISINDLLLTGEKNILLQQPENNGWIVLMVPDGTQERKELLSLEEYHLLQEKYK
jgi:glycine cleavage system H protein